MAKRKNRSKRSLGSLPKGLPHKQNSSSNPFEISSLSSKKRPKHEVHNRQNSNVTKSNKNATEVGLQRRRQLLKQSLNEGKKANVFLDRRIGEYDNGMTTEQQNLARLVRERSRRSKRSLKFSLEDDDNDRAFLTHRGKVIDGENFDEEVWLDEEDENNENGNLDAMDTALHFGGGALSSLDKKKRAEMAAYGQAAPATMEETYLSRKMEMDDLIMKRKLIKAERIKNKEQQVEAFTSMDESFKELSSLLQFRDKEKEIRQHLQAKREGTLEAEDKEMADWNKEMREYMVLERKVKATDRTKTPEEIAREKADQLHELETRRLARMNGDFEDDDFSDIQSSDDDDDRKKNTKKKKKKKKKKAATTEKNPDELESSDGSDDSDDEVQARFTADGLVYMDKNGKVVKKSSSKTDENKLEDDNNSSSSDSSNSSDSNSSSSSSSSSSDEDEMSADEEGSNYDPSTVILKVGTRVEGNYHADEQFEGNETWYKGTISKVNHGEINGTKTKISYDIDYDDGDYEQNMSPENVRPVGLTKAEKDRQEKAKRNDLTVKRKRQKAKEKASIEIPFVFEIPTTLDALHDMIGNYASTGKDASLIIERIYTANSVKLDRRNIEKMQNFYDVLLRRFIAIGDAIYASGGPGGPDLGRFQQLDSLTKIMYLMAQDSPDCAGAVWARRIGILHKAHMKRLRDIEFLLADDGDDNDDDNDEKDDDDEEEELDEKDPSSSAWPSMGTVLLLRAMGHIFPVTDRRHYVVTPTVLLLGHIIAHTPVLSMYDLVAGTMLAGLQLEYTKDASRVAPEGIGFLAGVIRLYARDHMDRMCGQYPVPSLNIFASKKRNSPIFASLRNNAIASVRSSTAKGIDIAKSTKLSLERSAILRPTTCASILVAALNIIKKTALCLAKSLNGAEREVFAEVTNSLLLLNDNDQKKNISSSSSSTSTSSKETMLPQPIREIIAKTATTVSEAFELDLNRKPLMRRRSGNQKAIPSIKSLAPRMEDPEKYSRSRDKGKNSVQVAIDRTRREYKREHKAISRELRLDASFIENERRKEKAARDSRAKEARQRNFAWLEGEQATMNQQVRLGGGLLKGGGMGAAKSKASSGKLGIKRGGKF